MITIKELLESFDSKYNWKWTTSTDWDKNPDLENKMVAKFTDPDGNNFTVKFNLMSPGKWNCKFSTLGEKDLYQNKRIGPGDSSKTKRINPFPVFGTLIDIIKTFINGWAPPELSFEILYNGTLDKVVSKILEKESRNFNDMGWKSSEVVYATSDESGNAFVKSVFKLTRMSNRIILEPEPTLKDVNKQIRGLKKDIKSDKESLKVSGEKIRKHLKNTDNPIRKFMDKTGAVLSNLGKRRNS